MVKHFLYSLALMSYAWLFSPVYMAAVLVICVEEEVCHVCFLYTVCKVGPSLGRILVVQSDAWEQNNFIDSCLLYAMHHCPGLVWTWQKHFVLRCMRHKFHQSDWFCLNEVQFVTYLFSYLHVGEFLAELTHGSSGRSCSWHSGVLLFSY